MNLLKSSKEDIRTAENDAPPFTLHIYNFTTQQSTGRGEGEAHLSEKGSKRGCKVEHVKCRPRLGDQHPLKMLMLPQVRKEKLSKALSVILPKA